MAALVIVAAGRGSRAGAESEGPKQYRRIGGKAVIRHALEAFSANCRIEHVVTVIHEDDRALYGEAVAGCSLALGPPVTGGATRQQSVLAGLEALTSEPPEQVLIHDAARPFVDEGVIARVLGALDNRHGAVPALAVTDTLKRADAGGRVTETVARTALWRAQTPQGFRFAVILAAHRAAAQSADIEFTDDAAIAEWAGLDVALVPGAADNVKLTTAEDMIMAERKLRDANWRGLADVRVGSGFDVHRLGEGDGVILCGVEIPLDGALVGHSDADVALHALTDALLGALGEADIGAHFPPSEREWRGVSSDRFLLDARRRIERRNGVIANVDLTLICEAPRIGPHRERMRASLAELLGIEVSRVSVKATTSEGLGFTGRGEGIAAMASITIRLPLDA